jgi:alpha-L-fucosidase
LFAESAEEERTAWLRSAKFGMFIHWGPYSLASVEASWPIMRPDHWNITEAEYRSLPARFNSAKWDPDHFIDLARVAGQQYMVFTTKHHDGFCMFDSSLRFVLKVLNLSNSSCKRLLRLFYRWQQVCATSR